jgi:DNA-binding transcriptional LysR family regulator
MELRYLRYFIAVAEDLSFSHAAERLHVDQSALSRRVQDLEYELRLPLFRRTRQRVALTPAGDVFLLEARRLLADADSAVETARRASRGEVGRLDIGYIGALSDGLIPRLLRNFKATFPQVAASLRHMRPARQIAALLSSQIHLGFVGQPNPEYELQLVFEVFRRDPMEVVIPSGHPLLGRKQLRLSDLAREKFILLTRVGSPFHYDWLMRLCHEAGFHPDIVQEAEFAQTAVELVAAGYGVSLFPATAQSRARDDVVFTVLRGLPRYEHSVAWRRGEESPDLDAFLNMLREETKIAPSSAQGKIPAPKPPAR